VPRELHRPFIVCRCDEERETPARATGQRESPIEGIEAAINGRATLNGALRCGGGFKSTRMARIRSTDAARVLLLSVARHPDSQERKWPKRRG